MGTITIKISNDGSSVEMDAQNFDNSTCKDVLEGVEKVLGDTTDLKKKVGFSSAPIRSKKHQTVR